MSNKMQNNVSKNTTLKDSVFQICFLICNILSALYCIQSIQNSVQWLKVETSRSALAKVFWTFLMLIIIDLIVKAIWTYKSIFKSGIAAAQRLIENKDQLENLVKEKRAQYWKDTCIVLLGIGLCIRFLAASSTNF